ncbi:Transcription initiation factor TFIID subunit 1 [Candida viswanathii]|uniref:Transcription initiation factor TFIID subunit 1 n=1 Tax=Candida viswanathii TaxID=5486 RepID=A0A367XSX1_9ASCO|nr:Transcription initiation factor TFIID subunit 1 [Candida viswanathii]
MAENTTKSQDKKETEHADDAIDYEDIDELADDEEDLPMEETINGERIPHETHGKLQGGEDDDDDEFTKLFHEGQPELQQGNDEEEDDAAAQAAADDQFDAIFGGGDDFHEHELHNDVLFNDLDNGNHLMDVDENDGLNDLGELRRGDKEIKKQKLEKIPFNFHEFFSPAPQYFRYQRPAIAFNKNIKPLIPTKLNLEVEVDQRKVFKMRNVTPAPEKNVTNITQADLNFIEDLEKRTSIDSFDLVYTDWDDDAIINAGDDGYTVRPINEILLETSPEDLEEDEDIFNGQLDTEKLAVVPTNDKLLELKFNFSNDQEYELLRKNYNTKQRSQLSNLNIEHSFLEIEIKKRKKDKGKSLQQVFSKTTDLTATDTANLVALEYSEQYPPILSNFGMGSKLINYYRKERANDTSRPKAQVGETHILGVEDRSPFWNFGEVAPEILFLRAGSHQKFYLRAVNFNFAVGNTFPVEVPAPHSRKVTNISKNRLKMVVFRVMNNLGAPRISVKDVSKHFPEHTDMQNRQRLKEFMEYQRQGDDQGYWKVRGLNDETKRKKDEKKDDNTERQMEMPKIKMKRMEAPSKDQDAEIDAEEELAPWNLSRNFVIANQTKAMLQLNGEGDPTGIGLGFSMLRATQKNPFKPFNAAAHNQKLYEQEIKRIWYSQRSSLPNDHEQFVKSKVDLDDQKVLRITRRVRDENGIVQRRVETISDPRLIRAYDELLKNADVDEILPTNDKELNKIRRKALADKLANLEKPTKGLIHAAAAAGATIIDANTVMLPDGSYVIGGKGIGKGKSRTRRCKNCGAYGHIRTNAKCPLYKKMMGGAAPSGGDDAGDGNNNNSTSTTGSNATGTATATAEPQPIVDDQPKSVEV